ncbi:TolC family protein [Massilia scottii]|uniref:TolC family protein n=1 Tax=Massilia scottii TaxID=3057166 RepID=UPI0027969E59|nr:TolC family protein [Massilia sp. CCM 9029]MDQ1833472.1 TolC family protein [Massilia sp. CCM 9029]
MYKLVLPLAIAVAWPCHTQAQNLTAPALTGASAVTQQNPGSSLSSGLQNPARDPAGRRPGAGTTEQPLPDLSNDASIPPAPANAGRAFADAANIAAPLSLAGALSRVLQANSDLRAGVLEIDAQSGAVMQAGAAPNPELATVVDDARESTRTTTVQLNVPIELGGKRTARVNAAQLGHDAAGADLAVKRNAVLASTRAAFYDLLAAQQRQHIAGESLTLANGALAVAAKRVLAGKNSPVDETRARIAASSVKVDLAQAAGELAGAKNRLAALWGGTGRDIGRADGHLDRLPAQPSLPHLMEQLKAAPALRLAQTELARRLALSQVERAGRVPDVTLSIGAKRDQQVGRNQAVFGLAIPLPLFDRNQGKLHEALQRSEKARAELDGARARLTNELAQAHEALTVAREQAQLLNDDIVPGAQSAYEAARTGFEYGKFNFIDVIDAQRTLLQARTQHLRALADAHRAAADIDSILGASGATQTVE